MNYDYRRFRKLAELGAWASAVVLLGYGTYSMVKGALNEFLPNPPQEAVRSALSHVIERASECAPETVTKVRSAFRRLIVKVKASDSSNHPHAYAADARTAACNAIDDLCARQGLPVFSYQYSRQDVRRGIRGFRSAYWARDLDMEQSDLAPLSGDAIRLIDVDYHDDFLESKLVSWFAPVFMYTILPIHAGGRVRDTVYGFDTADNFVMRSVGVEYCHRLWDYSVDTLLCYDGRGGYALYYVDHRRVDDVHSVVLLTPRRRWFFNDSLPDKMAMAVGKKVSKFPPTSSVGWWVQHALMKIQRVGYYLLAHAFLSSMYQNTLSRIKCVENGYAHLQCHGRSGLYHSISRARSQDVDCISGVAAELTPEIWQKLENMFKHSKVISVSAVSQQFDDSIIGKVRASIAHDFFSTRRDQDVGFHPNPVTVPELAYQVVVKGRDIECDAPAKLMEFMAPMAFANVHPDSSLNNQIAAVAERVEAPGHKTEDAHASVFLVQLFQYFARSVKKFTGPVVPYDLDQVFEKMKRPSQQHELQVGLTFDKLVLYAKMFQKAEAYATTKPPRGITQMHGASKLRYSALIYPLMDALKEFPCFTCGKNQLEIDEKVASILLKATSVTMDDMWRMDGTFQEPARVFERVVLREFFGDMVNEVHDADFGLTSFTRGTKFEDSLRFLTGYSRLSGSHGTYLMNSLVHAFLVYLAWFYVYQQAGDINPHRAAWKRMCATAVVSGDDGVIADLPVWALRKAMKAMGFVVKESVVQRGNRGVNFLSRYYSPAVWYGSTDSICDVKRQVGKLHLAKRDDIPGEVHLVQRLMGYIGDLDAPIIGDITRMVFPKPNIFEGTDPAGVMGLIVDPAVRYKLYMCHEVRQLLDINWVVDELPEGFDYDLFLAELANIRVGPVPPRPCVSHYPVHVRDFVRAFYPAIHRAKAFIAASPHISQWDGELPRDGLVAVCAGEVVGEKVAAERNPLSEVERSDVRAKAEGSKAPGVTKHQMRRRGASDK